MKNCIKLVMALMAVAFLSGCEAPGHKRRMAQADDICTARHYANKAPSTRTVYADVKDGSLSCSSFRNSNGTYSSSCTQGTSKVAIGTEEYTKRPGIWKHINCVSDVEFELRWAEGVHTKQDVKDHTSHCISETGDLLDKDPKALASVRPKGMDTYDFKRYYCKGETEKMLQKYGAPK